MRRFVRTTVSSAALVGASVSVLLAPLTAAATVAPWTIDREIAPISLIDVEPYSPSDTTLRGLQDSWSRTLTYADGSVRSNIEKTVHEEVTQSEEFLKFVPRASDREAILGDVMKGIDYLLSSSQSDIQFAKVIRYVGDSLFGVIIEHALEKEGISSGMAEAWKRKILARFDSCVASAANFLEAKACKDSAKAGLPQNIGLAIVHSMATEKLLPPGSDPGLRRVLRVNVDTWYRNCAGSGVGELGSDAVRKCVVATMRLGVLKISDQKMTEKLAKLVNPQAAARIHSLVFGPFRQCLDSTDNSAGFHACVDRLTIGVGTAAVREKVLAQPAVNAIIGDQGTRIQLASAEESEFEKCALEQKKADLRKNGILDIGRCKDAVERHVTDTVLKTALDTYLFAPNDASMHQQLHEKLFGEFGNCLDRAGLYDDSARLACRDVLTIDANETIGGAVGENRVNSELGPGPHAGLKPIKARFHACMRSVKANKASKHAGIDSCMKEYTKSVALLIANTKLRASIGSAIGTQELVDANPEIDSALADFRGCLDRLNALPYGKPYLIGVATCASSVTNRGRGIVRARLDQWFGKPSPGTQDPSSDARALMVGALPCLNWLIPSSPEKNLEAAGVDVEGTLKATTELLKKYIDYDASKADVDIKALLDGLRSDLASVGPAQAREDLLLDLQKRHVLDQVIKALTRSQVTDGLGRLDPDSKLAPQVVADLTSTGTFDKIFSEPRGQALAKEVMDKIIRPVLVDGRSMQDPAIRAENTSLQRKIVDLLADSPDFGSVIIGAEIQGRFDRITGRQGATGAITRFWIKLAHYSMDWSKVRQTTQGRAAEDYIRNFIVKPAMQHEPLTEVETYLRTKKATELVSLASKAAGRD